MNSRTILVPLMVSLIVVAIAVIVYYVIKGVPPGAATYIEEPSIDNSYNPNQAKFMFFYTDWCSWSQKAQTSWASFKQTLKNNPRTFGGTTINFEEVNCEFDKSKASRYKINAYPTFKVENKDKLFTMQGNPSVENFRKFLIMTLGQESS